MANNASAAARPDAPAPAAGPVPGAVFTVAGLSFSYGSTRVFDGLDLALPEGKITTIIGANGSGKSTLFNLMTKNLAPDAGAVFLRGGNVADLSLKDFARLVAIVHQTNTVPPGLSVKRLVSYGRSPHHRFGQTSHTDEDDRMIAWALETCDLASRAEEPLSALSGGQRQRAWIAMSLAQGTKVLLLDEPTTYLDVRYQLDVLRLVRRLNREFGMTVVMVLHDINQSLHYSDEVVALAGGRVVAQGAPDRVVSSDLVREVYGIDLEVVTIGARPFVLAV